MRRRALVSLLSFASFVFISIVVILLANGYQLNRQTNHIYPTGILMIDSTPSGAIVNLNNQERGSTNTTISSLTPGTYDLSLKKPGYANWHKQVVIAKDLVTTIKAILVPSSPSLAPVSTTAAVNPTLSPDGEKLIYAVRTGTSPGIWLLDLTSQPFNLNRKPSQLLADTPLAAYSSGTYQWSPTSREVVVTLPGTPEVHDEFSIDEPTTITNVDATYSSLMQQWSEEQSSLNKELLSDLGKDGQQFDSKQDQLVWSPDNLSFFYREDSGGKATYMIYTKETKTLTKLFEAPTDEFTVIRWYPDSLHLLLLQKKHQDDTTGTVSLMDNDGANVTQVYSGTLIGDALYSFLNGTQLIILTSFNLPTSTYYLYGINLR